MAGSGFEFSSSFVEKVDALSLDWDVHGVVDSRENVYSLTYDAKIIGRVFELLAAPAVREVASEGSFDLIPAGSQTIYPDFTLVKRVEGQPEENLIQPEDKLLSIEGEDTPSRQAVRSILDGYPLDRRADATVLRDGNQMSISPPVAEFHRLAVDVKTTYREFYSRRYTHPDTGETYDEGDTRPFVFTLGSYASFLRDNTKNIQFDYRTYSSHYVIGFLYTRNSDAEEGLVKDLDDKEEIPPPYHDVEYFVQEKYKIAGISPGSGNTENIGSFKTNDLTELREGNGPFAEHGKEIFEQYWKNYGRYREDDTFTDLDEFFSWREENLDEVEPMEDAEIQGRN